jgi:hypothetical protein
LTTIAIDPGKNGGIAYQLANGETYSKPMPATTGDIIDLLRTIKVHSASGVCCFMESLVKYVGNNQAGSAAIVYGQNYGFVEGAVQALGIRLKFVRPQQWMKALGLGTRGDKSKTLWKNKLKAEAQRLFPAERVTLATADALLILEYATTAQEAADA